MVAPWISVDDLEDPTSLFAQEAVEAASFVLWHLSGRKYGGERSVTEVYCQIGLDQIGQLYPRTQSAGRYGMQVYPTVWDGQIINQIGGCCSTCGCPHLIRLRGVPVLSVQSLTVGSRSFVDDEIRLYDYSYVAAGSGRCWSSCDDVEVSYTYGSPPPVMGRIAARALANQYLWAMDDDERCTLPQRVTQISRQGTSWTLLDPQDFLDRGLTGIYQVDLFLRTVNPDKARMRARVFSPDIPRARARWDGSTGWGTDSSQQLMVTPMMVGAPPPQTNGPQPMLMSVSAPPAPPPAPSVVVYANRPLRWAIPGSFSDVTPPVVRVRPSGVQVSPGALTWRSSNYTLDLTANEVSELLTPTSTLVVSSPADNGSTSSTASYPVEWRTA